jgi:4-hydroxy-3-methylbut-2-enyl diphosphate reductase
MITAHGASERTLGQLHERGLAVVEATCPLVRQAQQVVKRLAREGYHPIIIGQRQHVEVRGLTEDLAEFDVVQTEAEVAALAARPRFGIAAQTTQPIEKVLRLRVLLQQRFPSAEFRFVDTVCQHTKQRQQAAVELARQCEVVMVIGGAHSNNTRELVATCRQYCAQVYHVQTAEDVCLEWLAGAETVGFTAGTSTPDHVIEGVAARLQEAAEVVAEETVAA